MAEKVTVLSGGLSTELEAAGLLIQGDPLWSARLLHTNPEAIKTVHTNFLKSGANVLSTATYQASIEGFNQHLGLNFDDATNLFTVAVQQAKESAERFTSQSLEKRKITIAGSIGPYGAFLHDGSEYTGNYVKGMSIESTSQTSFGDTFDEAVNVVAKSNQLVAVGVNCCSPAFVSPLLTLANTKQSQKIDWIVYPNSGEKWDHNQGWQGLNADKAISEYAIEWVQLGARWIGGCCRTTPSDIASIREILRRNNLT
ncbi:uncharacterized protein RB166_001327 isoform 3-T3 [Leptodactylus fuscus]|uniref:betaine-homocysteine S-methyltransferase-like isoform X3 n=1 Tax=Leptodactylus fuscus TaxID=238119 RepID=UPI003F4E5D28